MSTGTRSRQGPVTVVASPSAAVGPRIGLVVTRSVGNAVKRNRAKRRLRHALAGIPLEQSMDYVIIADRSVIEVRFANLVEALRRGVEKTR